MEKICNQKWHEMFDNLFNEWQEEFKEDFKPNDPNKKPEDRIGRFVADGIVCPIVYEKENKRILFVLKDTNDDGTGTYGPRGLCDELIGNPNVWDTWSRIVEWTIALLDGSPIFVSSSDMTLEERRNILKRIAAINLKKASGKETASPKEINSFSKKHHEKIKEELGIINPDLIITCGTYEPFKHIFSLHITESSLPLNPHIFNKKLGHFGRYFLISINQKTIPVLEYRHPSRSGFKHIHYQNMLKIRETFLNESKG